MISPLEADADLPICTLCGTQYPVRQDRASCPVCEDPRQWTKETGQEWTSLRQLKEEGHKWELVPDKSDPRLSFIRTSPAVGIGQSPMLIETARGSYIWDCAAFIDQNLVDRLKGLAVSLKAIIISHPHFYATSLTWSRALAVPIVIAAADKEWYMRSEEVDGEIQWFGDAREVGPGVKVIRCGGHFPGSSVLIWDRSVEPPSTRSDLPRTRIAFVADTLFVQPTQRGFTYAWSVPNLIPLGPPAIVRILDQLWKHAQEGEPGERSDGELPFEEATSSWPGRWIRKDAWKVAEESARRQLCAMGWDALGGLHRIAHESGAEGLHIQPQNFEQTLAEYDKQFKTDRKL